MHLSRAEYWCYLSDMSRAPESLSIRPDLPFRYIGGDPSVDLVDTADWTDDGIVEDRLTDYRRLVEWTEGAGVVTKRDADRLRRAAAARPREAEAALRSARWLRWVLQRVFGTIAAGERLSGMLLDEYDAVLAQALPRLRLGPVPPAAGEEHVMRWEWRELGERLDSILWPVVWSSAALLTSSEASRIRVCGGERCGWVYIDRSRNGLRRWCKMETCGTRQKSRRRAERVRESRA